MEKVRRIAFVGGGNMAQGLIGGIHGGGFEIVAADPDPAQRERLGRFAGVAARADNAEAVAGADLVVLAVKPQVAAQALASVRPALQHERPPLLSIVAGLTSARIESAAECECAVVRAMPNMPALVGRGISAFWANARVGAAARQLARDVLAAVGEVIEVREEGLLDAVTAVSGSGPAYFFALVEALAEAGAAAGLPRASAAHLARATGIGAMALLEKSGEDPAQLRRRVTSPGGTTAAALEVFARGDLSGLVRRAVLRAAERARELSTG